MGRKDLSAHRLNANSARGAGAFAPNPKRGAPRFNKEEKFQFREKSDKVVRGDEDRPVEGRPVPPPYTSKSKRPGAGRHVLKTEQDAIEILSSSYFGEPGVHLLSNVPTTDLVLWYKIRYSPGRHVTSEKLFKWLVRDSVTGKEGTMCVNPFKFVRDFGRYYATPPNAAAMRNPTTLMEYTSRVRDFKVVREVVGNRVRMEQILGCLPINGERPAVKCGYFAEKVRFFERKGFDGPEWTAHVKRSWENNGHVVVSSLNGNNGEATNTDDVEDTRRDTGDVRVFRNYHVVASSLNGNNGEVTNTDDLSARDTSGGGSSRSSARASSRESQDIRKRTKKEAETTRFQRATNNRDAGDKTVSAKQKLAQANYKMRQIARDQLKAVQQLKSVLGVKDPAGAVDKPTVISGETNLPIRQVVESSLSDKSDNDSIEWEDAPSSVSLDDFVGENSSEESLNRTQQLLEDALRMFEQDEPCSAGRGFSSCAGGGYPSSDYRSFSPVVAKGGGRFLPPMIRAAYGGGLIKTVPRTVKNRIARMADIMYPVDFLKDMIKAAVARQLRAARNAVLRFVCRTFLPVFVARKLGFPESTSVIEMPDDRDWAPLNGPDPQPGHDGMWHVRIPTVRFGRSWWHRATWLEYYRGLLHKWCPHLASPKLISNEFTLNFPYVDGETQGMDGEILEPVSSHWLPSENSLSHSGLSGTYDGTIQMDLVYELMNAYPAPTITQSTIRRILWSAASWNEKNNLAATQRVVTNSVNYAIAQSVINCERTEGNFHNGSSPLKSRKW